jgi:hypothetical protein
MAASLSPRSTADNAVLHLQRHLPRLGLILASIADF